MVLFHLRNKFDVFYIHNALGNRYFLGYKSGYLESLVNWNISYINPSLQYKNNVFNIVSPYMNSVRFCVSVDDKIKAQRSRWTLLYERPKIKAQCSRWTLLYGRSIVTTATAVVPNQAAADLQNK